MKTARAARASERRDWPREIDGRCRVHGETGFVREGRGYFRCKRCRSQRVADWRRETRRRLVEEAGGRCLVCGYERCAAALAFHHLNPREKRFGLSYRGLTRPLAELTAEARKCVLLCSNCHAEVEAGLVALPSARPAGGPSATG